MLRASLLASLLLMTAAALAQPDSRPTPRPALAGALSFCLPGNPYDACEAALDAALAPVDGAHGPVRVLALPAPWLVVEIRRTAERPDRIRELRFEGSQPAGAMRRRLYRFFERALTGRTRGDSPTGVGCNGTGPAWFDDEAARTARAPRLQLNVDPIAALPQFGWPTERAFIESSAPEQRVHLCLFGPSIVDDADPFQQAVRAWLASARF